MPKIWQNLKNMNHWLSDSSTWIQEMLAHLKSPWIPSKTGMLSCMIISVTFHRLASAFESPCHWNHSLSPKCSDCVSIYPCFCHPLLTVIQSIPWTWLSYERSVWPLTIFRLVLRRTRNDSEYLQLEMHNIIKTCALEGATYCAPSHLKDVPKLLFVFDGKNRSQMCQPRWCKASFKCKVN